MKLGEKLQQLRKKSGLSQEQLAARLTVSRQAVSKWELDETMPDTENVVQLSRLFGVSCDYLLRDEMDGQGAPVPALPQADRPSEQPPLPPAVSRASGLDGQGWSHNVFVLALGICAIGLVAAFMGRINGHTLRPMIAGFIIQVLGVVLFELSTFWMGGRQDAARLSFYAIACWLVLPVPVFLNFTWIFDYVLGWRSTPFRMLALYFAVYLLLGAAVTAVMAALRRRLPANG